MSDIKASPKAEAWILRTGHGTTVVEHKPPCGIDLWQPLYTAAALREQLKDCSAAFDRQQKQLDRNTEQIAVLCNLLSEAEAERHKVVPVAKTDWITEELADGDKICAALGLERTEGGRLPVPKILSAIKEKNNG